MNSYKGYNLTNEQYNYITFSEAIDTKLIACAGSGKTQALILRNIFLLENNLLKNDEILLLVFGRMACHDMAKRAELVDTQKLVDIQKLINIEMIKTIDSLSKYIIDDNNKIDVSLLSYKFMLYLQSSTSDELKQNEKLNKIKCIFIDEAQDLNEIQYNILIELKNKLNIILNFIGDPNQNIFQFRYSESKYFTNYIAREFLLTTNFRSHTEIIFFSNKLRPNQTHQIISAKNNINLKPTFYIGNLEFYIKNLTDDLINKNIDLSDVAIISPVKGKIGINYSNGLCYVANILSKYNIPFKQYYDESKEDVENTITYDNEPNKIALMTIFGSKGLQFKHVILIGMKTSLINYYRFTEKQRQDERNLIYVACSRSIETLSIIVDENKKSLNLNHWFNEVDRDDYDIYSHDNHYDTLIFPPLKYNNEPMFDNRITRIIDNIPIEILNEIANLINYDNIDKNIIKIYDYNFSKIEYVSPIFLGKYVESLFVNLINIKNNKSKKDYYDIENIINSENLIECDNQATYDWIVKNKSNMIWDKFDNICRDLPSNIQNTLLIFKSKNKNNLKQFNEYTPVMNNAYYIEIMNLCLDKIQNFYRKYKKYNKIDDFNKLKKIQFYCEMFHHALSTQHYYHIKNNGEKFKSLLYLYDDMFNQIKNYVLDMQYNFVEHNKIIENFNLIGEIDIINDCNELFEIKVTQQINLKHILQLLMYNIMYEYDRENYKLNFINFMKGEEIIININLDKENKDKLIKIFQLYTNK